MSVYDNIYLISNIFATYIIFEFMMILFERSQLRVSKKIEFMSYTTYYTLNSSLYLYFRLPFVMLIFNLFFIFLLTFNYEGGFRKRLFSSLAIYLPLMCIETLVFLPIQEDSKMIFGFVAKQIISYTVVLVLSKLKYIKKEISIPRMYWICVSIIPLALIFLMLLLFSNDDLKASFATGGIVLILAINFSVFYLYNHMSKLLIEESEKLLFKEQNKYYKQQLDIMKISTEAIKAARHDMKNHILTLKVLSENRCYDELLKYLNDAQMSCEEEREFSHSGHVVVDSILNFKLQEARQLKAKIFLDISIPDDLEIPAFDITIILGNLLDNAIDAIKGIEDERMISVVIKYGKGQFIIEVLNSFDGVLLESSGYLLTRKEDISEHGFGIKNIKRVLKKYNGSMQTKFDAGIFTSIVYMYIG